MYRSPRDIATQKRRAKFAKAFGADWQNENFRKRHPHDCGRSGCYCCGGRRRTSLERKMIQANARHAEMWDDTNAPPDPTPDAEPDWADDCFDRLEVDLLWELYHDHMSVAAHNGNLRDLYYDEVA